MTPTDKQPEFHVRVTEQATTITLNGHKVASAWGPACASTDWFACRQGAEPQRFPSREMAVAYAYGVMGVPVLAVNDEPQTADKSRGICPECDGSFMLTKRGVMRYHNGNDKVNGWRQVCKGVGLKPKPEKVPDAR